MENNECAFIGGSMLCPSISCQATTSSGRFVPPALSFCSQGEKDHRSSPASASRRRRDVAKTWVAWIRRRPDVLTCRSFWWDDNTCLISRGSAEWNGTPQSPHEAAVKATTKVAKKKEHYRVPHDNVDQLGKLSVRRASKMHHLGVGIEHHFKKVFVVVDHYKVSVVGKKTEEVLSKHSIEARRIYQTNMLKDVKTKRSRKPK